MAYNCVSYSDSYSNAHEEIFSILLAPFHALNFSHNLCHCLLKLQCRKGLPIQLC